jgi:hypothetical protein
MQGCGLFHAVLKPIKVKQWMWQHHIQENVTVQESIPTQIGTFLSPFTTNLSPSALTSPLKRP